MLNRLRNRLYDTLHITLLDRYIIGKFMRTFFFTLGIFITIAVVFDYAEKVDDFIERKAPWTAVLFDYYVNFVPYFAGILSPLIIFIAVIFFTARLANNTEIVPMLGSGITFSRFLYPYFIGASILALLVFAFNGYITPHANKTRIAFENQYMKNPSNFEDRNIHMKLDDNTFIYMESFSTEFKTGYRFTIEKFKGKEMIYKLLANSIQWDTTKKLWIVRDYTIRRVNGLKETMSRGSAFDTTMAFYPSDFVRIDNNFERMTIAELQQFIEVEKRKGTISLEPYYMEQYKRFSTPFAAFILTLMGVSLSSSKKRGGIGAQLGIGIFLCFAFLLTTQFSTVFAVKGGFPPAIAAWIPNITFGSLSLYLLNIAPK